jgi:hypothetical protein
VQLSALDVSLLVLQIAKAEFTGPGVGGGEPEAGKQPARSTTGVRAAGLCSVAPSLAGKKMESTLEFFQISSCCPLSTAILSRLNLEHPCVKRQSADVLTKSLKVGEGV